MVVQRHKFTLLTFLVVISFFGAADRAIAAHGSKTPQVVSAGAAPRTIFRDGFESPTFSAWSQVQLGGDAKAVVQSAIVRAGSMAAELSESAHPGSRANLRKAYRAAYVDLTATGNFRVRRQGASRVPLVQLLDARSHRIATVYRHKRSIDVAYGRRIFQTRGNLGIDTWAVIALHVVINGRRSALDVRLNGRLVYRTRRASLGRDGVSILEIGSATAATPFTVVADAISVRSSSAPRRSLPINTALPAISGTPQAGQTLSTSTGSWSGTPAIRYTHRWLRCGSGGSSCRPIAGASRASYSLTPADVGRRLRVVVSAVNSVGVARSRSRATAVVQPRSSPPVNVAPPRISGTARDGQLLNADPGSWSGSQPIRYHYQWLRCDLAGVGCAAIAGATGASYPVRSVDVGDTLRVVVSAANVVGFATATSGATAVVDNGSPQPGIVALWHMNEGSGTTMFDSIANHDGTLSHVQLGLPGLLGSAYGFNGSSSYVSVQSATDLNPASANVTLTIHLQATGTPPPPPADWDVIRKGLYTTAGGEFKMEFQQSGQASCGFEGSAGYSELIAGPGINDGQWHTVQCVKTSSAIAVVVDGAIYPQSANVGSIANTSPVVIGARPGSDWYQGALDEASIQFG